jgi:hypothetical protein
MGLSDVISNTTTYKKIFISKQNQTAKTNIDKTTCSEGNILKFYCIFALNETCHFCINIEKM